MCAIELFNSQMTSKGNVRELHWDKSLAPIPFQDVLSNTAKTKNCYLEIDGIKGSLVMERSSRACADIMPQ